MTPEAPLVGAAGSGVAGSGVGYLAAASMAPDEPVVAGSVGTWRLALTAGPAGLPAGCRVRVFTDSDTDWAEPQVHDPSGANYLTLQAPPQVAATLVAANNKELTLAIQGDGVPPGEQVVVTFGDRSAGGPGTRAQTFAEARRYFWVAVHHQGTVATLATSPALAITGGDAVRLVVVLPSTLAPGQPFRLLVRAEDAWGNPAQAYRGTVTLHAPGITLPGTRHHFSAADGGVWWLEGCVAGEARLCRVVATGEGGLRAESNPARCAAEPGAEALYWGDPHGGQIVLADKIPDFFRYARDVAGIDFVGYQRNDHAHANAEYAQQQAAERVFEDPGRFVPLPGFEWSGEPDHGGHHNVYFRRHGQPMRRNSHAGLADKSDAALDLPHVLDLHRHYRGADVVITPHVGGGHADLQYHEPALEPALEITSSHGTFEWFWEEALERRYQLGVVGGSDSHDGRPGADTPGFQERRYAKGGLTALSAPDLTLEGIHRALKARRCYATTGARILISVAGDGHPMGTTYAASTPPAIAVEVEGTAPLEAVELYRWRTCIYRHQLESGGSLGRVRRVRLLWEGAARKTSYAGVVWDGRLRLEGAGIRAVQTLRFDSPRSAVLKRSADALRWQSVSCGYRSGLVLDLDGESVDGAGGAGGGGEPGGRGGPAREARLWCSVATSLITRTAFGGHGDRGEPRMSYAPAERVAFDLDLESLRRGPRTLEIGTLNRRITASLAPPADGTRSARFSYQDTGAPPGINAYWLRVVQTDQEMAWTSPVFVDQL